MDKEEKVSLFSSSTFNYHNYSNDRITVLEEMFIIIPNSQLLKSACGGPELLPYPILSFQKDGPII